MKNNKGITIIALVVTIIVLLILSSISISYVVNKNGIIDNVNKNKENAEIRSIESKLQTESTSFNIQNNGKLNLDKYISKVKNIDEWNVEDNDDEDEIAEDVKKNIKEILVNDKYVFEIKLDSEGIKIEYLGKKEELGPRIIWHTYSNTYDTLTLNVVTRRNQGGNIQYWIKERGRGEYELKSDQSGNTYNFIGLDINKKYTIKVIAKKGNKQSAPYIIDVDMVKLPELTDENTTFIKTPEVWTNEDVIVTAQTKVTGYTIQTSQDGENWENITYQTVKKNGKVYARLSDGYNSGKVYETEVTNIDKLAPNEFTPTATSTTKSITVTASTTDAAAANGSGSSGIAGYRFSKDNGSTWTAYQNKGEYTWDKLPQTTNYTIKVEAKDNAGNVRQGSVSKGTGTVETATGGTYSPTTWTNGNVTVTLPTKSGFTTRYTIDGTKPTKDSTQYTGEFTVSSNCTITYLYTDGTNIGGTGSLSVTNIDKLAPNTFTPTATSTTKSITVTASTTDAAATSEYGSSGIAGYRFSLDNGSTWTAYQNKGEYTWDKLPQTTNYTIKVEAKDNAGNVRQGSVSKGTGTVETATGGTYSPTTWTNGNVTVTLPTKSGFTTRYTIDGTKPTKDSTQYTGEFTVSSNCTITYLYTDGTNIGGTGALSVTNIDKTQPVVTETTATTNKITIKAKDDESGIVGYAITTSNTVPSSFTSVSSTKSLDTSLTGYKQNTTYYVWAKDAAGNVSESKSTTTGTVTALVKDTNIKFTPNTTQWVNASNGVEITVSTTVTDFILQTSIDGTNWNSSTSRKINKRGETIYARLWDGYNAGISASYTPTNIDDSPPTCQISITTENICKGESVGAKLDLSDQYSGISTIKYVLSTSSSKLGTTESLYKNQEEMPPSTDPINLYTTGIYVNQSDVSHVGNEYIHVLVIDNAGNKTEIISSPIYFGNTYLLANKVSVGDYVSYDATNAYSYTSPTGTGTSHGNGDSSQKFKSSSDMKWRVLRVDNGEVVLISETPTKENLKFKGAIFYLYAEQEINSICALYGHGIGANKNKNFSYRIGNESYDTNTNNHKDLVIEDSGARSLSYNDVQIAYGSEYVYKAISDGDNNSGTTGEYFPAKHYYPSFSTSYGVVRLSTSTYIQTTKKNFNLYDAYRYGSFKKEIENELIGSTKKDGRVYLLSTRCTSIPDTKDFARYYINKIIPSDNYNSSSSTAKMEGHWLLDCYSNKCVSHDHEDINDSQGLPLRPIVYLKSTVQTAASTTNGSWKILDR